MLFDIVEVQLGGEISVAIEQIYLQHLSSFVVWTLCG